MPRGKQDTADRQELEARAAVLSAPPEVLLTAQEVAIVLGITPGAVRRWNGRQRRGGLKPVTKRAGRLLYTAEQLRRWLAVPGKDGG